MNISIINELTTSRLMISSGGLQQIEGIINDAYRSKPVSVDALTAWADSAIDNKKEGSSVLVIPITGVMTKYARFDFYSDSLDFIIPGIDDIAYMIDAAERDPNISGSILLMNTPGGTTQSWIRIEEVLRKRTKPCIAVVDGLCASAGMYVASFCDKVIALNDICQVGSIGVMATLVDTSKAEKQAGIKIIEVYPPESNWKNKSYNDALDGNTKLLIEEELSPLAQHFQATIRRNRRNLNEEVEGVLAGRMFFAADAIDAGLIDAIMPLDDVCALVEQMSTLKDIEL